MAQNNTPLNDFWVNVIFGPSEGGQGQIEGVKPTPILWFFKIEISSFF